MASIHSSTVIPGLSSLFSNMFSQSASHAFWGSKSFLASVNRKELIILLNSSLIVSSSTVGPDNTSDTNWVNPVFTQNGAVIYYRTRGVIDQSNDIVAYRRIKNASSFNIPSGGAGFGHTMY